MDSLPLPFSGTTPISRQHSALAAQAAAEKRGEKTLEYLALLDRVGADGVSDHDAARMLGLPLSSINSIRNGCADLIEARPDAHGASPYGRRVTLWRRWHVNT